MLPSIRPFSVVFDRPRLVRFTLAGLNRFYGKTGHDPFELFANGKIAEHWVDFFWCLASVDHADLTLETARKTFTIKSLFAVGDELAGQTEPHAVQKQAGN